MVPKEFLVIMRYPAQLKQLLIYPTVFFTFYIFEFAHLTLF